MTRRIPRRFESPLRAGLLWFSLVGYLLAAGASVAAQLGKERAKGIDTQPHLIKTLERKGVKRFVAPVPTAPEKKLARLRVDEAINLAEAAKGLAPTIAIRNDTISDAVWAVIDVENELRVVTRCLQLVPAPDVEAYIQDHYCPVNGSLAGGN